MQVLTQRAAMLHRSWVVMSLWSLELFPVACWRVDPSTSRPRWMSTQGSWWPTSDTGHHRTCCTARHCSDSPISSVIGSVLATSRLPDSEVEPSSTAWNPASLRFRCDDDSDDDVKESTDDSLGYQWRWKYLTVPVTSSVCRQLTDPAVHLMSVIC